MPAIDKLHPTALLRHCATALQCYGMRLLLQKVTQARVSVNGNILGEIGKGYLLFLGIMEGDQKEQADRLVAKVVNLRLFSGRDGKINDLSLRDVSGEVLVVSQFTLAASFRKGNRPDYTAAAPPQVAQELYEYFIARLISRGVVKVAQGAFGASMQVLLCNDGPVTLWLEA